MLDAIEQFSRSHAFTIAAFGVLSTFLAVIVSLALALLSSRAIRTRLRASVEIYTIAHDTLDPKNPPRYLAVDITNTGAMPLRVPLSFLRWKLPLRRNVWLLDPLDSYSGDPLIAQKKYPVEIAPRASQTF